MSHTTKASFTSRRGQTLAIYGWSHEAENASGESFGEAALPTFINEKRDYGTEQFAELLLREALPGRATDRGRGKKTISLSWLSI